MTLRLDTVMNLHSIGLAILAFLPLAALACDPDWYDKIPSAHYEQRHKISYVDQGKMETGDDIRIFERREDSFCFVLDTARKNLHVCQVAGEARRTARNEFQYKDSTCFLRFHVSEKTIRLQVSDPLHKDYKNWCKHESCGEYGSIDNATFTRIPKSAVNR